MKRILFFILCAAACSAWSEEWHWYLHDDLTNSTVWYSDHFHHESAGDADYQNAAFAIVDEGSTNLVGTQPLGETLPAGTYSFFLKGVTYSSGSTDYEFQIIAGGSTGVLVDVDVKNHPYLGSSFYKWSLPGKTFSPSTSFSSVDIRMHKTGDYGTFKKWLLMELVLSSDTNTLINKFGEVGRFGDLSTSNSTVGTAGNILANSSLELPMEQGWWNSSDWSGRTNMAANVTDAESYHGDQCAQLFYKQALHSRLMPLKNNQVYSLSFWAKANRASVPALCFMHPAMEDWLYELDQHGGIVPEAYDDQRVASQNITLGTTWTKYYYTNNAAFSYPSDQFFIGMGLKPDTSATTSDVMYIDQLQFEEGPTATTYALTHAVEYALEPCTFGGAFTNGQDVDLRWGVANYSGGAVTTSATYSVYDYLLANVTSHTFSVTDAADGATTWVTNTAPPGAFGFFSYLDDLGANETSITYLPAPRHMGAAGVIGGTYPVFFGVDYLKMCRQMGEWNRVFGQGGMTAWINTEDPDGTFHWPQFDYGSQHKLPDLAAISLTNSGLKNCATLYDHATWAEHPTVTEWTNYIYSVVDRYKDVFDAWEVGNETNGGEDFVWTAENYAMAISNASLIIRDLDPTALIVGLCATASTGPDFIDDVRTELGAPLSNWMDAVSYHIYPRTSLLPASADSAGWGVFAAALADEPGIEIWNTEGGSKAWTGKLGKDNLYTRMDGQTYGEKDSRYWWETFRTAPNSWLRNALYGLTEYCDKIFYYEHRLASNLVGDHQYTAINHDDRMNVKGCMLAGASYYLDGRTNGADLGFIDGLAVYAYQRSDGVNVAALYNATNMAYRTLSVGLDDEFHIGDMFGNLSPLTGTSVRVGFDVTYLWSTNTTWTVFTNELSIATSAPASDTTPPNVVLTPYHTTGDANSYTLVAAGIDALSFPTHTNAGVQYSWQFGAGDFSTWTDASVYETNLAGSLPGMAIRVKDDAGNIATNTIEAATEWRLSWQPADGLFWASPFSGYHPK